MVDRAEGISSDEKAKLLLLALRYRSIWKLKLGDWGAAKVTPLRLQLRHDAVPKRAQNRRYCLDHLQFTREFVRELESAGCVRRNPKSRWSSPVYVVGKPGGKGYRMTIDVRYPNSQLIPLAGVMPVFEVILSH